MGYFSKILYDLQSGVLVPPICRKRILEELIDQDYHFLDKSLLRDVASTREEIKHEFLLHQRQMTHFLAYLLQVDLRVLRRLVRPEYFTQSQKIRHI